MTWSWRCYTPLVEDEPNPDVAHLLGARTVVELLEETHYVVDEDVDLCLRLKRQGAPILWPPRPGVVHHRGEGSRVGAGRRLHLSTISYLRFLRRHCSGWVLAIRSLRLVLKNLLMLPLRPHRSLAALGAVPAGLGWRPSVPSKGA